MARNAVHDLQKLVSILKIDPDNVRLEIVPDNENKMGTKLVQSKITAMMGPSTTKGSSSAAKSSAKTSVQSTSSEKTPKDVKEKESTSSFATPKLKEPPASSAAPMVAVKSSPTPDGGSLLADRTNRNVSNSSGTRKRNSSGGDSKLKGTGTPSRVTKRKASAEEQLETEPRVETEPRAEVEPRVKMKQIRRELSMLCVVCLLLGVLEQLHFYVLQCYLVLNMTYLVAAEAYSGVVECARTPPCPEESIAVDHRRLKNKRLWLPKPLECTTGGMWKRGSVRFVASMTRCCLAGSIPRRLVIPSGWVATTAIGGIISTAPSSSLLTMTSLARKLAWNV